MTRFMQTLLLTIYCNLSLAEVKKSPDVSSAPTCKAGDADSCGASSEIDSPDDVTTLLQTQVRIKEHGGEQTRSPHASALVKSKVVKSKLDIYQQAYVDGKQVFGCDRTQACYKADFFANLNKCHDFPNYIVYDHTKPDVKVCGTGIKMTVYLLGRCGEGSITAGSKARTWDVGSCDSGQPPSTCQSFGVSDFPAFQVAQSYEITQC